MKGMEGPVLGNTIFSFQGRSHKIYLRVKSLIY